MDIVAVGNFHIGNRDIAPVFTKTGRWYDYLTGDSLEVTDVNMIMPFVPGEYHVYTSKRIPLGFDITTSVADVQISNTPLQIRPTISHGTFVVDLPQEIGDPEQVFVFDMAGRRKNVNIDLQGDQLQVTMQDVPAGVYMIHLLAGKTIHAGRMIIQ